MRRKFEISLLFAFVFVFVFVFVATMSSSCGPAADPDGASSAGVSPEAQSGSKNHPSGEGAAESAAPDSGGARNDRTGPGAKRLGEFPWPQDGLTPRVSPSEAGLRWLAARQAKDGGWEEGLPEGAGESDDPGLTGLVLKTFLGLGYTNRGRHAFAKVVSKGLRFLKDHRGENGRFTPAGRPGSLLDHVAAASALIEVYGMTGSPIFKQHARAGLEALAVACETNDVSLLDPEVARQALLAVLSARMIDEDAVQRGRRAPFGVDLRQFSSLEVWRTASLDATGRDVALAILTRLVFDGNDTKEARRDLQRLAEPVVRQPLSWTVGDPGDEPADWSVLNFSLEAVPGKAAHEWQRAARRLVKDRQAGPDTAETVRGSWDPETLSPYSGGRIRLTAHCLGVLWHRCYGTIVVVSRR